MIAAFEARLHRWRRRLSRSEWAIKHLGLTPSEGTSELPGLLLLQIDGLSRRQLEEAVARGRMPFLRQLLQREGYGTHTFYSGLPSTTPAVQAELYYGVKSAVPAFSFFDRSKKTVGAMFNPDWAKSFEASFQQAGHEGLLTGGSSWSNIYTGGATQAESHFCGASIGFGDMWRTGKIRNIFVFILLQFPAALRIAGQLILKTGSALGDAIAGMRRGEKFGLELIMAFSRIFIGTGLRELVTIGGKVDLARGLPIVHVNFLAYDEQAHRRGPSSRFAHHALRATDRAIKNLYQQAQRSSRRDYAVWIFSDHGQEEVRSFAVSVPGGIEEVIHRCLENSVARDPAWKARSQRRASPHWLSRRTRVEASSFKTAAIGAPTVADNDVFTVTAVGPLGHVYFHQPFDEAKRFALARRLVKEGTIPGVLLKSAHGAITWFHAQGETAVPGEVSALLPHPAALREEIARDLTALVEHTHSGDLILLGWSPWEKPWTFAPERGAHGGMGPEETQAFALLPPRTRLPETSQSFLRPATLRQAAWYFLGRGPLEKNGAVAREDVMPFRVMTYNVHGCSGMDGRISPRRIARVIDDQAPDIVALQEIDHGRTRSRAEDQSKLIAEQLGMHYLFCPTVIKGSEHYGHLVLSRWPLTLVKRALLPSAPGGWWPEPRAALWVKVTVAGREIHVITTHLGLSPRERQLQIDALLGDEWIGGIAPDEPVVLCGDFNLTPRSRPYAVAAKKLRDVQRSVPGHQPKLTFSSARPFARLDYIFVSAALATKQVAVPRNHLTRLASDHLPLVVDLQAAPAAVATTTHSR